MNIYYFVKEKNYLYVPVLYLRVGVGGYYDQVCHVKIYLKNFLLTISLPQDFIYDAYVTNRDSLFVNYGLYHEPSQVKCSTEKISAELFFHDISLLILTVFYLKIVKKVARRFYDYNLRTTYVNWLEIS